MNNINIIGNLTDHAKIRQVGETDLATFTVAYNKKYKDKKETYFFDCEAWGSIVSVIKKHVGKGSKVAITGELIQSKWQDKETQQNRSKCKIRVMNLDILTWVNEQNDEQNDEVESFYG